MVEVFRLLREQIYPRMAMPIGLPLSKKNINGRVTIETHNSMRNLSQEEAEGRNDAAEFLELAIVE